MTRWETTFGRWVQEYGVIKLRDDLTAAGEMVTTGAIYSWVAGRAVPVPDKAKILIQLGKGKITWEDIYSQRLQATTTEESMVQERIGPVTLSPAPQTT